jgi:glycosyltransferase involved in cell wall biosynthesis
MKVSIITAVLNRRLYIEDCINSVIGQTYKNIEHIIVDGVSRDGTLDILRKHQKDISVLLSEPDDGIYDAMNKGIRLATGNIIGILNSDDIYAENDIIAAVAACFAKSDVDTCYGDLIYIKSNDVANSVRYWKAGAFSRERFREGWMPPHPTFFVRRHVYERCGLFNLDFPLAADYELMLRFLYKCGV